MKNKLLNINNILRIVISLFVIGSMIKSCSKATTYDDFVADMNILYDKGMFSLNTWQYFERTFFNECKYYINRYGNYAIFITSSNSQQYPNQILIGSATESIGIVNNSAYPNQWGKVIGQRTNLTNPNTYWRWDGTYANFNTGVVDFEYIYTTCPINTTLIKLNPGEEYGGSYINANFEFIPNGEQVTYQDYVDKPYANLQSYSNSLWKLGEITDYAGAYKIEARFTSSSEEITKGTITFLTEQEYTKNNNMIVDDNFVYIQSRDLYYNQIYYLIFYLYDENDILLDSSGYNILFLPLNAKITAGEIIDYGSGDFNIQDSANTITEAQKETTQAILSGNQEIINNLNNSSEVDSILNETLSGDIESVASDLGFTAFDNPFTSFLFFVIDGVYDVLTEKEDITLNTVYKSLQFDLASTDFITPESGLKTFIRNMLICVYIYGNYKYFHYMITLLETARINKFMAEIGTDEFYDTDIM